MTIAVFIIFMATLALVDGLDCLDKQYKNKYERFLCKHTLQQSIPVKAKKTAWTTYIKKYGLCNRKHPQSFMSKKIFRKKHFCQGNTCEGNLCTSDSLVSHYTVSVNTNCRVTVATRVKAYVVVACENVRNLCRPVHFHGIKKKMPNWDDPPCS